MNAQQYTDEDVLFEYQPIVHVSAVVPSQGIREGSAVVTVLGTAFSARSASLSYIKCRFNTTVVSAEYYSVSKLKCLPTSMEAGYATVEVSNNARDYTSDGVQFEFVSVRMTEICPWGGPLQGSTAVTFSGTGFMDINLQCKFGT